MMPVYELNLDGLVGPTHHYAGLADGNKASLANAQQTSNPMAAARQGIQKMRLMHRLGLKQAVMPPHQRPNLQLLHQLGFTGSPMAQIKQAKQCDPRLLSAAFSASSMWTANAATVSASMDTLDKRIHMTAANLTSNLHRHHEADFSQRLLKYIFSDKTYFEHHDPLPKTILTRDEGAANHSRLCKTHAHNALTLFTYGIQSSCRRFPARQTLEASHAIARSHLLNPNHVIFACQNPEAIDEGVFHNDVICVANESVLFLHEDAFLNQRNILNELQTKSACPLTIIEVRRDEITLKDAVNSYLFNSQLVTTAPNQMVLIAPSECNNQPKIKAYIDGLLADTSNPISQAHYLNLKQSMQNGGGPACLRLRIPLNERELSSIHQGVLINDTLLDDLDKWVLKHYRTQLNHNDLDDPDLITECFTALDALTSLLKLGAIYPFQTQGK